MKQILLLTLSLFCFGEIRAKENRSNDDIVIATLKEDAKLYEAASTKSTVLYDIRNGNTVKVLEQGKTMSKIKFLRLTGYVDTSKLNIKNFNSNTTSQPRAESTSTRSSSTTSSPQSTSPSTVKSSTSSSRSSSTRSSSSYSSTCGARTKKGGSCRRKVSGGGYCWQHR